MTTICDGCSCLGDGDVYKVTAKQWMNNECKQKKGKRDVFLEDDDEVCVNFKCIYNIDGVACVYFYFCEKCLSDRENIERVYREHTALFKS